MSKGHGKYRCDSDISFISETAAQHIWHINNDIKNINNNNN